MATPKDRPGRLDIVARARSENAPWLSTISRCRREVGHAGRAGLVGIVSLFFEASQYLERSREPGRRLARPMEFSRTRNPSRPKRASKTQGKRARFKENADRQSSDPRDGKRKGVNTLHKSEIHENTSQATTVRCTYKCTSSTHSPSRRALAHVCRHVCSNLQASEMKPAGTAGDHTAHRSGSTGILKVYQKFGMAVGYFKFDV